MEGLYFLGLAWGIWIISTFWLRKNSKVRLPIASFMLLAIILSPFTFSIGEISVSYLSILIVTVVFLRVGYFSFRKKIYFFFTTLIVSIGYGAFLLFELFDPIWIFFKREWMLSILLAYLSVLIQTKLAWRISIILAGCIYGDIIYVFIIKRFSFPYTIGSLGLMDVLALSILFLFAWEGVKISISYLESLYHHLEKEKQNTT
jgi:hypothetical protein